MISKETLKKPFIFKLGCLVTIFSICFGYQIKSGTNTLFHNGNWKVEKRELKVGVTGSDEFLSTRAPLYKNQLSLGRWYGHHSIRSPKIKDLNSGKLRFRLNSNQYLSLKLNNSPYSNHGVVISADKNFISNYFTGEEKNYSRVVLKSDQLKKEWNKLSFKIIERELLFELNDKALTKVNINGPVKFNSITIRSGLHGAIVDDIYLNSSSHQSFEEHFFDHKGAILNSLYVLIILIILLFLIFHFFPSLDKNNILLLLMTLIFCQNIFLYYDVFIWSKKEISPFSKTLSGKDISTLATRLERIRFGLFHLLDLNSLSNIPSAEGLKRIGYPTKRIYEGPILCIGTSKCSKRKIKTASSVTGKDISKLVLIGTSQSVGSGARTISDTFFSKLHFHIQKKLTGNKLVSLNFSESGSNPETLYSKYSEQIKNLNPEIFIINLVNNGDDVNYYKGLRKLVELGKSLKSRVFLIQEAVSIESDLKLNKRREFISSLSGPKIHIIDLNSTFRKKPFYAGDFNFWDFIHLTNQGHHKAGIFLADEITKKMTLRK
ncbi:MAG: SGNH/GDSL hydrolase family protein [Bacteriovoracaceae bacterium]|nr:SGNH/GDSL hydrolase family protein [Bacteriovoracaceae bacterium]